MNVIFQFLGYGFRLVAVIIAYYLALNALDFMFKFFGFWGYVVGILTLPVTIPAAVLYQNLAINFQLTIIIQLILLPLLWSVGGMLIRAGRSH